MDLIKRKRKGVDQVNLDEKEIIRLYTEDLLSVEEIRKIFNVNYATIKLRLVRNGITLRTPSEQKKITMNKPEVKKRISEASKRTSEQRMKTTIERYGVPVASNNPEKRKKWQDDYIKEHGVAWNKDPERLEKSKTTCLKKYGVENPSQTEEAKEKISQNRWKNKSEEELEEIHNKCIKTFYNNNHQDKVKDILNFLDLEVLDEYKNGYTKYNYRCKKCDTIFGMRFNSLKLSAGCPTCNPRNVKRVSKGENEIIEFLSQVGIQNIVKNSKYIIPPYELDIFIPDFNMAIEYNGLWYHCDGGPNANKINNTYHLTKTELCQKENIRLIHIFEDEWIFKKDIVKSRLTYFLGLSNNPRIYASKCTIKEITPQEKNIFLNTFHIQGADTSRIKLGAFYKGELISVMTFSLGSISKGSKLEDGIWELSRFCSTSKYNIVGIAGKLLKHFQRNYGWKQIFTYADRRWSNGHLYYKLGFTYIHTTRPNYWYVKDLERGHRYNFRKKVHEPKDIPEWVLRRKEGYYRIWDCGNLKFNLLK